MAVNAGPAGLLPGPEARSLRLEFVKRL